MGDPQLEHHRRHNQETAAAWEWFASHRARVTAELVRAGSRSVGIWGAGNCNDVDLQVLLQHYGQVTLYDIDYQAMIEGVERQSLAPGRDRLALVAADAFQWGGCHVSQPPPRHEITASICLLSQLCHYAQLEAGQAAADPWQIVEPVRSDHISLLLHSTEPSGRALLFNDFVSSDTCLQLTTCDESELPGVALRELASGNFFTGMNPWAIRAFLEASPEFKDRILRHEVSPPWRWNIGPRRAYAVCVHRIHLA